MQAPASPFVYICARALQTPRLPLQVRFASKSAKTEKTDVPKVDQRKLAAQRERENKRARLKREAALFLTHLKDEARESKTLPHSMDVRQALRYIRAAEVGRPAHATTLTLNMRIVAERGVQKVTGSVKLPHALDEQRICVLTSDPALAEEARRAGATLVGADNIITSIKEGQDFEYDKVFATPDMESRVKQVARILGPRGLMPNAKRGTITTEIYEAISTARGELSFAQSDTVLALPVGRASFSDAQIVENTLTAVNRVREVLAAAPSAKKGYIGRALLTSTMSPSIVISV